MCTFLAAHKNIQVLHLDISTTSGPAGLHLDLPLDALPQLRELRASREVANAILQCPCSAPGGRPLETLKGLKLSGSGWDDKFLRALRCYGGAVVKRIELAGWNEMDDIRKLVECVPKLVWLDIGKRTNSPGVVELSSNTITGLGNSTSRNAFAIDSRVVRTLYSLSCLIIGEHFLP